jgi:hypothetical protein
MTPPDPSRREFVRVVALGGAAGLIAQPAPAGSQDEKLDEKKDPAEARREAEVQARMGLILARYGDQLDDDARKSIRRDVEAVVRRGERLRQFALENGDEPFPVFRPYRKPLGG